MGTACALGHKVFLLEFTRVDAYLGLDAVICAPLVSPGERMEQSLVRLLHSNNINYKLWPSQCLHVIVGCAFRRGCSERRRSIRKLVPAGETQMPRQRPKCPRAWEVCRGARMGATA